MNSFAEILLIAIFMSAACALPGNFLVLRRMSMLTDAISHTVLLGIVLTFLAVGSLDSPLLIIGASLMGVLTVWLIELLYQSRLVASDSAIGLCLPSSARCPPLSVRRQVLSFPKCLQAPPSSWHCPFSLFPAFCWRRSGGFFPDVSIKRKWPPSRKETTYEFFCRNTSYRHLHVSRLCPAGELPRSPAHVHAD